MLDVDLEMILQVLTHPWQMMNRVNAHSFQLIAVPHSGELKQLR
jgi:hypothetical protein